MRGRDIFCSAQTSTVICRSMDEASASSSSNSTILLGGRAIDRHNPIIRDSRRAITRTLSTPSSLQSSINSKPHPHQKKTKTSSSSKINDKNKKASPKENDQKKKGIEVLESTENLINSYSSKPTNSILKRNWIRPPDNLITPPGSTRYLLSDTGFLDGIADSDPVLELAPFDKNKVQSAHQDELISSVSKPSSSSKDKSSPPNQVVVLKVSLHCKGCAGKLRKHLSRMEGVTSFNIDFAAKKVTIVGNVTPLGVLSSVSKVKNAQFWPVSVSPLGSASSETKKGNCT